MGLNDNVDEGLPSEDYVPEFAKTPDTNSNQVPAPEVVLVTPSAGNTEPQKPVTAEQLFGENVVPNELPNLDAEFVVVDDKTDEAFNLTETKARIAESDSIAQEDAKFINDRFIPGFINDKNPLGYYSKVPSKSRLSFSLEGIDEALENKYRDLLTSTEDLIKAIDSNGLAYLRTLDEKLIDNQAALNVALTKQLTLCGEGGISDIDYTLPDGSLASNIFFERNSVWFRKQYKSESEEGIIYCCNSDIDKQIKKLQAEFVSTDIYALFSYLCCSDTLTNVVILSGKEYHFDESGSETMIASQSAENVFSDSYREVTYEFIVRSFGGKRGKVVIDNLKAAMGILLSRNHEALEEIKTFTSSEEEQTLDIRFEKLTTLGENVKLCYSLMCAISKIVSIIFLSLATVTNILIIINTLRDKTDVVPGNPNVPQSPLV